MLLITDTAGPIAVAGVMGGADTEVGDSTTNVLLESANFDFINNRRTAQALKLPSEATARFGRGVDPEGTVPAAQRASELMRQLAGGTIAQGVADAYVRRLETKRIVLTVGDDAPAPNSVPRPSMGAGASEVKRILGMDVSAEQIKAILESLEFRVGGDKAGRLIVTVPSYRLDVSIPADLIEDIARLIGYDQIPTTLMSDVLPPQRRNRALEGEERVRDILVGCGLQEVITYSLTTPEAEAKLSTEFGSAPYIRLANPISSDRVVMRRTLQSSLLENLALNLKHHDRVLIFEIGRVYLSELGDGALPAEPRRLAIAMTGPRDPRSWRAESRRELDFFDLKGVVEALLTHLHLEVASFEPIEHPIFHPGRAARLKVNSCHDAPAPTNAPRPSMGAGTSEIGILGELHPQVVERFDLGARRVSLAELDLDALLVAAERPRFYEPLSRFPAVQQDIALIVDDDVPAVRVRDLIAEAGGKLLRHVELFDLYRGQPIPAGKKSLAYSLTFQADDRTLTDDEVARLYQRIVRRVNEAIGAELRGNQ
jgi:phenylalanyl-tRNA synthetase beta chain